MANQSHHSIFVYLRRGPPIKNAAPSRTNNPEKNRLQAFYTRIKIHITVDR